MEGFREFFYHMTDGYTTQEVVQLYLNSKDKIKEISQLTGKSIGEIYRILHNYNVMPNRLRTNHRNVIEFANFGFKIPQIAEFTGYTPRNVRIIIKKYKMNKHE